MTWRSGALQAPRLPKIATISSVFRSTYLGRAQPASQLSRRVGSFATSDKDDLHRYTSGRWLWNEEARLQERYTPFNVLELQKIAARSVGADSCDAIVKLADGSFNRTLKLVADNGTVIIAKIPYPIAGPAGRMTASEVATMNFASTILGVPVPKVLAWSADSANAVQSEYILMEEAIGQNLDKSGEALDLKIRLRIVQDLIAMESKLQSTAFTQYGSIYFSKDAFQGCEKACIHGDVPASIREDVAERFVIGPVALRQFWARERASMDIGRGPWKQPQDFLGAIAQREIAWLQQYGSLQEHDPFTFADEGQTWPDAHIVLYKEFHKISQHLFPRNEELTKSVLWHCALDSSKIFVTGDRITSVIGWQNLWAGPLVLQAQIPDLVALVGEIMSQLPPDFETIDDPEKRAEIESRVEHSALLVRYQSETERKNPVLHRVLALPQLKLRKQLLSFADEYSWGSDMLPFRDLLIRAQRYWNRICPERPCPIAFSYEEVNYQRRHARDWNNVADFWDAGFVHRDGWTSHENYEDALQFFARLREEIMEEETGETRAELEKLFRFAEKAIRSG